MGPVVADDAIWRHTAGPFRGMNHRFAIRTTDEALGRHIDDLWSACHTADEAAHIYGLESPEEGDVGPYRLHAHGAVFSEHVSPSIALRDLVRRLNAEVIASAEDLVVMHAAGATRDGVGVLLPASSESGKTTLVAGLTRAGWGYLSDEAIGIDPATLRLHAYLKPMSVDPGSWDVLADLRPDVGQGLARYHAEQWQVAPEQVTRVQLHGDAKLRLVVAPRYEAGAQTRIEPMSQIDTLRVLADSCFTIRPRPQQALDTLAAVSRITIGQRLVIGDLDEARHLLWRSLAAQGGPAGYS